MTSVLRGGAPAGDLAVTLLPGAPELLAAHARALPQRDDLCGAFCGSLALSAAGLAQDASGGPLDQDAVALAAGSLVSATPDPGELPGGTSRRDYRLELPRIDDGKLSGTTAGGVVAAIEGLSQGRLAAIPYAGPSTPDTLGGLFDLLAGLPHPAALLANHATRYLWGSRPGIDQLLAYLLRGVREGPAPDWDVGHFACVVAAVRGPGGRLYLLADTYPALGAHGLHLQPQENLAAAIERREMPAGGVIAAVAADDAPAVRAGAAALGLQERTWDNGTATAAMRA
jgi:uncharacterized protein DUF6885